MQTSMPLVPPPDKSCNDLCPITHRPLSAGRPDGVWVLSILYATCVVTALLVAGLRTVSVLAEMRAAGDAGAGDAAMAAMWGRLLLTWIPAVVVVLLCATPVVLLFRRKAFVVMWEYLLLAVCVAGAGFLAVGLIRTRSLGYMELAGLLLPILAHVYAVVYTSGLREDGFLQESGR